MKPMTHPITQIYSDYNLQLKAGVVYKLVAQQKPRFSLNANNGLFSALARIYESPCKLVYKSTM
jgi:hypothetical protein